MNTYSNKAKENNSQSMANTVSQRQNSSESTFKIVDNRPEAMAQRKLQAMADKYSAQRKHPIQKNKNNTGLPDNLKTGIENLSGYSMDDVKVHYNSDKPAQLQAHAYAQGTDIHLASGQERHLPHEAWHVVQQKQGRVKSTMQLKDEVNVNDDAGLEKEADLIGAKAVQFVDNKRKDNVVAGMTFQMMNKNIIQMVPEKESIIPFKHSIDGEEDPQKSLVHVDGSKLLDGNRKGTNRAFMTIYAAAKEGSKFKDIQSDKDGKIKATEGDNKQTWINFGNPQRAQHYVVTYALQHLKSDHKKQFDIAQDAANVARILQDGGVKQVERSEEPNIGPLKRAVIVHENQGLKKTDSSLFHNGNKFTDMRKSLAQDKLQSWGDEGPIIRSFLVDDEVTERLLNGSVVESDKKKTQSEVINVDQTKAANQIGISGNAKRYFFEKGIQQGSLESIVPNLDSSIQGTSSFEMFEEMYNLESTLELIARLGSNSTISLPQTDVFRKYLIQTWLEKEDLDLKNKK